MSTLPKSSTGGIAKAPPANPPAKIQTAAKYGLTIPERIPHPVTTFRDALRDHAFQTRVAVPAIIQDFDAEHKTVVVRPAILEYLRHQGAWQNIALPDLADVPIVIPRAGGYAVTLPIRKGDECLVVFGDMCMDSWWEKGAQKDSDGNLTAQPPMEYRRHDMSDGFAIIGCWSQPNTIDNYSTTAAQIRKDDGSVVIELADNKVTVTASQITLAGDVEITGTLTGVKSVTLDADLTITGNVTGQKGATFSDDVKAGTISMQQHVHTGVQSGGSLTGVPKP